MKNRMLPLLFICCLPALQAQSYCDFQKLINDGKRLARKENYEMAMYKFNSSRRCDPRDLVQRRRLGDVRIEPAARRSGQVGGQRPRGGGTVRGDDLPAALGSLLNQIIIFAAS